MATRTAPTFNGTPSNRLISIRLVDASDDTISIAWLVPVASLAADIEGMIAAYQLATQASVYEIIDTGRYTGAKAKSNADTDEHNSVADGVNMTFKNLTTTQLLPLRVVAPTLNAVPSGSDTPDLSGQLQTVITAMGVLQPTFPFQTAQFTERTERSNNPKVTN